MKKGVIFSTYSSLIGESQGGAKAKYKTRLKQLVHWFGEKFDGVVSNCFLFSSFSCVNIVYFMHFLKT